MVNDPRSVPDVVGDDIDRPSEDDEVDDDTEDDPGVVEDEANYDIDPE